MRTALYEKHQKSGAKFTSFAGWEMPLCYKGILHEHTACRQAVGLFDVSHMGQIYIYGKETLPYLDFLSVNTISEKPTHSGVYTLFCDETGAVLEDLFVFLLDQHAAFVVVNAANREKTLSHMRKVAERYQVDLEVRYNDSILSLQGPKSIEITKKLFPIDTLAHFHFIEASGTIISRTGYTGEEGFEFFTSSDAVGALWEKLLEEGVPFGIEPSGLGARDVLRLEMGYALYGHELTPSINALENVASWTVKLTQHNFLGKHALERIQQSGPKRHSLALLGSEGAIAREGNVIYHEGRKIGYITSGTFSPSLGYPIALGLTECELAIEVYVEVEIRSKRYPFKIVKLPFYVRQNEIHRNP